MNHWILCSYNKLFGCSLLCLRSRKTTWIDFASDASSELHMDTKGRQMTVVGRNLRYLQEDTLDSRFRKLAKGLHRIAKLDRKIQECLVSSVKKVFL